MQNNFFATDLQTLEFRQKRDLKSCLNNLHLTAELFMDIQRILTDSVAQPMCNHLPVYIRQWPHVTHAQTQCSKWIERRAICLQTFCRTSSRIRVRLDLKTCKRPSFAPGTEHLGALLACFNVKWLNFSRCKPHHNHITSVKFVCYKAGFTTAFAVTAEDSAKSWLSRQ